MDTVIEWLQADGNLPGLCVCDAGCGVGSLSIPLADAGAIVCASDISEKMVAEAYDRSTAVPGKLYNISFAAQDLEALTGNFHTVICLDVLIHYPQNKAAEMIAHLSSIAESRLIISFAPKTLALTALKKFGELFPARAKLPALTNTAKQILSKS